MNERTNERMNEKTRGMNGMTGRGQNLSHRVARRGAGSLRTGRSGGGLSPRPSIINTSLFNAVVIVTCAIDIVGWPLTTPLEFREALYANDTLPRRRALASSRLDLPEGGGSLRFVGLVQLGESLGGHI